MNLFESKIFVNGVWKEPSSGEYLEKLNPSTGELYGRFPSGTKEDVAAAVESAHEAQKGWERLTSFERSKYLYRVIHLISSERSQLENLLMQEVGKPMKEAVQEVDGALDLLQYYSEFARKITGDVVEGSKYERVILQYKVPYGVVVAITSWNFPAAMNARKLGPALITGNTVVLKPSSDTPFVAQWMVKKFQEAGLPRGVVNLITGRGSEIGDSLTSNKKVGLIAMTGETRTGQRIMKSAASSIAKLILELGGKAPFIVWFDADLDIAAKVLMWAKYWNAGQSCIAAERLYVHEDIYTEFMDIFWEMTKNLKLGGPPESGMGPLISKKQQETVSAFVESAEQQGARALSEGFTHSLEKKYEHGFFYPPTILENARQDMKIFREEIFGPVIGVMKVRSFDEAIDLANDSDFGLASYLFTSDARLIMRAAKEIKFGELYTNMPGPEASQGYHTGFRLSGQSGENSRRGVEEYVKIKNVYLDYSENPTKDEVIPPY